MARTEARKRRVIIAVLAALVIGVAAYAFTAANAVPDTTAGAGSGTISGYTVTDVQYGLNSTTPMNLDQVTFTISPAAAATVRVQLAPSGAWYSCTNASGSVTCATTSPQATVAAATRLTVVAAQ